MTEHIVDCLAQRGDLRKPVAHGHKPRMQGLHDRLRLGLPNRLTVFRARSPDAFLDGVHLGDPFDHFLGEGRLRRLVNGDKLTPRMGEAKCQTDFSSSPFIPFQRLVGGIAIDLQHARELGELCGDLLLASPFGEHIGDRRRRGPMP